MGISQTTTAAELIPNEIIQESRLAFQKNATILPFIRVADISGVPGKAAEFPVHTTAAVTKDSSETTDITTNSAIDPTSVTLTVARRTVRIDVSDLLGASAVENVNVSAGKIMGAARIKQVESDVLGNMTTNYTSSVGATDSTAITPENILSALLTLKVNEADENLLLAIHPKQEFHLLDDLVVTSSGETDRSSLGMSATMDGGLNQKTLFGFRVFSTPRVSTGTNTNDIYLGMAFNGDALGYVVKNIPPVVELQRDASAAVNEIVMNYYDSSGRLRADGFVEVLSQTY